MRELEREAHRTYLHYLSGRKVLPNTPRSRSRREKETCQSCWWLCTGQMGPLSPVGVNREGVRVEGGREGEGEGEGE